MLDDILIKTRMEQLDIISSVRLYPTPLPRALLTPFF